MNLFKKSDISKKEYYKEIKELAIPAFSEKLLLTIAGLVSSVILGRATGSVAMSAAAAATTVIDILQSIYLGFGLGASILIARESGRDNPEKKISEITSNSLYLNAATGLILGILCLIFSGGIMGVLFSKNAKEVTDLALSYLKITLPFSLVYAVDAALSSCFRGAHDAKTPFYITVFVNVLNAILCLIFILGFNLGIHGAAVSYVISLCSGCVIRFLCLKSPRSPIKAEFHKPNMNIIKRTFNFSLSSSVQACLTNLAFLGMQAVTAMIGTVALAGYQVANNIIKLTYCITYGFEAAQITLVGNQLGKNNPDGARLYTYGLLHTVEILCLLWALIMFVFARPLCLLFVKSEEAEALANAVIILRVLCFSVPLTTYFQGCQGALKVGGENAAIIISTALGPWAIKIPLSYILVKLAVNGNLFALFAPIFENTVLYPYAEAVLTSGITGMMVGFFADYIARCIIYGVRLYKEKWLTAYTS